MTLSMNIIFSYFKLYLVIFRWRFTIWTLSIRAVTRTLVGGGGCIFIYSCSAWRVFFQIKFKLINLKRNLSGRTWIYTNIHPPINVLVTARLSITLCTLYECPGIEVSSICLFIIFKKLFSRKIIDVWLTSNFDIKSMSFNHVVKTSCNRRQIDLHFQHFHNVVST